jgi:hypothetical protein
MVKEKVYSFLVLLVFAMSVWYVFYDLSPQYSTDFNAKEEYFSTDRAFEHVKAISKSQHHIGSLEHSLVRNYIVNQLEKLNLKVHTQQDYYINEVGDFSIPQNIVTKIGGENPDAKSLLVLTHYDSQPHTSYGASDAASIAAVLESIRAFLASGKKPIHDIVICFTDAEKVGSLGKQMFYEQHPWSKNIGLTLHFDARGSAGPSYMMVKASQGNAMMIKELADSNLSHSSGSSFISEVLASALQRTKSKHFDAYNTVPDLSFAFIDNPFNYDTSLDTANRLDKASLAHQGEYAYNLIHRFSDTSLEDNLKSEEKLVYFKFPEIGLIYFPVSWRWYVFLIAIAGIAFISYKGFQHNKFSRNEISIGFIGFLAACISGFGIGFLGWKLILYIHPEYSDIIQGFPYNSHDYIFALVCISIGVNFFIYNKLDKKLNPRNAFIAPILVLTLLCGFINIFFPSASYFSIVLLFSVLAFALTTFRQVPNLFLVWALHLPLVVLAVPLIQFIPIAFGMKMVYTSTLLSSIIFGLLICFLGYIAFKRFLALMCFCVGFGFLINAYFNSDFNKEMPKPNSLIYVNDLDTGESYFGSFDETLDKWNKAFFEKNESYKNISEKGYYSPQLKHTSKAPVLDLKKSSIEIEVDTINPTQAKVKLTINPEQNVNRIELYTDLKYTFETVSVNNKTPDTLRTKKGDYHIFYRRFSNRILNYNVVNQEALVLYFESKFPLPVFEMLEISYDLLENNSLDIPERPNQMIAKPLIWNDAIIQKRKISFE